MKAVTKLLLSFILAIFVAVVLQPYTNVNPFLFATGLMVVGIAVPKNLGLAGVVTINGLDYYFDVGQAPKLVATAAQLATGAEKSQFTDRVIYDTLPMDGRTQFNFFENCGSRAFPRTNLSENKLQRKENMVVKFMSIEVVTFSAANTLPVVSTEPLSTTFPQLYRSDLSLQIGQSTVLKKLPLDSLNPSFNPFAKHTSQNIIMFQTDICIIELLEFIAGLQSSAYTVSTTKELMLKLHGVGTLFSPQANF